MQLALGLQVEIDCTVHGKRRDRKETDAHRKRVQHLHQPHRVGEVSVRPQRQSVHRISNRHTKEKRRQRARRKEREIPEAPPEHFGALAPKLHRDTSENQAEQQQHEREIQPRKRRGIRLRKRREERAAEHDKPDLVAVPQRPDRVHHYPPLAVIARQRVQDPDAEIEPVEDRVAREQNAEQNEPQ